MRHQSWQAPGMRERFRFFMRAAGIDIGAQFHVVTIRSNAMLSRRVRSAVSRVCRLAQAVGHSYPSV